MIANKHTFWCRGVSKLLILVPRGVQTINAHLNTYFKLKFRCCGLSKLLWSILNSYLMVNILKFWCHRVPKLSLLIYHMIDRYNLVSWGAVGCLSYGKYHMVNKHTFWCRGVSKLLILVPWGVQTVIDH